MVDLKKNMKKKTWNTACPIPASGISRPSHASRLHRHIAPTHMTDSTGEQFLANTIFYCSSLTASEGTWTSYNKAHNTYIEISKPPSYKTFCSISFFGCVDHHIQANFAIIVQIPKKMTISKCFSWPQSLFSDSATLACVVTCKPLDKCPRLTLPK